MPTVVGHPTFVRRCARQPTGPGDFTSSTRKATAQPGIENIRAARVWIRPGPSINVQSSEVPMGPAILSLNSLITSIFMLRSAAGDFRRSFSPRRRHAPEHPLPQCRYLTPAVNRCPNRPYLRVAPATGSPLHDARRQPSAHRCIWPA